MSDLGAKIGVGFLGMLAFLVWLLVVAVIIGLPVMWLWNWLMPVLFGLTKITFWQAVGLYVLCGTLFKSASTSFSKK